MTKQEKEKAGNQNTQIAIPAPKFGWAVFRIRGTAPYVQNKFSAKAMATIRAAQEAGSTRGKGTKREGKDFDAAFSGAQHRAEDGWIGIPAGGIRNALVSACRVSGFQMTKAKLSVFVEADGFDKDDGTPLVRITKGEPVYNESYVRNESGVVDLRARPMWMPGWEAEVRVRFDQDQFTLEDVANLMMRVGMQVGIGEGRPDSKRSTGMGWGLFELVEKEEV